LRRANFVPDHMRHHRRAMILDDYELQSVAKSEVGDCGTVLIGVERRGRQRTSKRDERQIYSGKHRVGPEYRCDRVAVPDRITSPTTEKLAHGWRRCKPSGVGATPAVRVCCACRPEVKVIFRGVEFLWLAGRGPTSLRAFLKPLRR